MARRTARARPRPRPARPLGRWLLWGAVAAVGLAATWMLLSPPGPPPRDGIGRGSYALVTQSGQPFTQASLRGRPSLVVFGFTWCPDICPATLARMAGWRADLGTAGADLRLVLITVDPERDTPEGLAEYLGWIPGAIGVTGPPDEIARAARAFGVTVERVEQGGGDYTVNHSAAVLLFDAGGRFREAFGPSSDDAQVLERLRAVLDGA